MVKVTFKGKTIQIGGHFPTPSTIAPDFTLTDKDLNERSLREFAGKKKLISIVPSLDTSVCLTSTHKFSHAVKGKPLVLILISGDLPFAQQRVCTGEKLDNVLTLSTFRTHPFLASYGVEILEGPLKALTARAVLALDESNKVLHSELVSEITNEPNYDAAINAIQSGQ